MLQVSSGKLQIKQGDVKKANSSIFAWNTELQKWPMKKVSFGFWCQSQLVCQFLRHVVVGKDLKSGNLLWF
jgi:hypothetical protein